jgi:hypothetical protein
MAPQYESEEFDMEALEAFATKAPCKKAPKKTVEKKPEEMTEQDTMLADYLAKYQTYYKKCIEEIDMNDWQLSNKGVEILTKLTNKAVELGATKSILKKLVEDNGELWFIKDKPKSSKRSKSLDDAFNATFEDSLAIQDVNTLLACKNISFEEFKEALCDASFTDNQIRHWSDKHIVITNRISKRLQIDYLLFKNILKDLNFASMHILKRFVCYFIHDVFVMYMGRSASEVFYKCEITDKHSAPIMKCGTGEFKAIKIKYITDYAKSSKTTLKDIMDEIPLYEFKYSDYIWDHKPITKVDIATLKGKAYSEEQDARQCMSLAVPFRFDNIVVDDEVVEEDISLLLYYLKTVLCSDDEGAFEWLMQYLAKIIFTPDSRTGIMLILYSEERCGKSTLHDILKYIMTEANIGLCNSMADMFGERGCTSYVGKKVVWCEELIAEGSKFRGFKDRMKTFITDERITYKPLYQEVIEAKNTLEIIASTNNMTHILKKRMTVLRVSKKHQEDHVFYGKLRKTVFNEEYMCKFLSYLHQYLENAPTIMKSYMTEIQEIMADNSCHPFESFMKDLKKSYTDELWREEHFNRRGEVDYLYSTVDDTLKYHQGYFKKYGYDKPFNKRTLINKTIELDSNIKFVKIFKDGKRIESFAWPDKFFETPTGGVFESDSEDDSDTDEDAEIIRELDREIAYRRKNGLSLEMNEDGEFE